MDMLNQVQRLVIQFANDKGISLHDQFGTEAQFKQFVIALTIKSLVDAGATMEQAWNATFGNGSYDKMLEQVWHAARSA